MENFDIGKTIIIITFILAFIAVVLFLKSKKGNISIKTIIPKKFIFNLSANWENVEQKVHKNKKKKS